MRTPGLIVSGLCVAALLAGCGTGTSSTPSTSGYTGTSAGVASTVNLFAGDASNTDATGICENVITSALRAKLNGYGSCHKVINNQLNTVSDFSLTIKRIHVIGSTAQVQVRTLYYGKHRITTLKLVRQHKGWRLASIG